MSFEKSKTFPLLLLEAIPVGIDLEQVRTQFLIFSLEQCLHLTPFNQDWFYPAKEIIIEILSLYRIGDVSSIKKMDMKLWELGAYTADKNSIYSHIYYTIISAACFSASGVVRGISNASYKDKTQIITHDKFADKLLELLKNTK